MSVTFNLAPIILWTITLAIGFCIGVLWLGEELPDEWGNPGKPATILPPRALAWATVIMAALTVLVGLVGEMR